MMKYRAAVSGFNTPDNESLIKEFFVPRCGVRFF